jgi:hypothetical protein
LDVLISTQAVAQKCWGFNDLVYPAVPNSHYETKGVFVLLSSVTAMFVFIKWIHTSIGAKPKAACPPVVPKAK